MIFNVTGGGGAALNFKVLAYPDEATLLAATPAENTIGIITTTDISGWSMGDYPNPHWEMSEGYVYIAIKASSYGSDDLDFGVLKKGNEICIAPISAKQYVSGAWVDVTCKSYQGWVWHDWRNGEQLYEPGNEYESITGGWISVNGSGGAVSIEANGMVFETPGSSSRRATAYTSKRIDVTDHATLSARVNFTDIDQFYLGLTDFNNEAEPTDVGFIASKSTTSTGDTIVEVDISSISGSYYVALFADAGIGVATKVYME